MNPQKHLSRGFHIIKRAVAAIRMDAKFFHQLIQADETPQFRVSLFCQFLGADERGQFRVVKPDSLHFCAKKALIKRCIVRHKRVFTHKLQECRNDGFRIRRFF